MPRSFLVSILFGIMVCQGVVRGAESQQAPDTLSPSETPGDAENPYDLFDPVPRSLLRPVHPDRPGATESPYTLDAGHFQIETTLMDFKRDTTAGVTTEQWRINHMVLKAGINLDTDFQLAWETYKIVRSKTGATLNSENKGVGDLTARLKFNLLGNDEGAVAFAIVPYLKIPTNGGGVGNDRFEGGMAIPFAADMSQGWGLGITLTPQFIADSGNSNDYHFELTTAIGLSKRFGMLEGYLNYVSHNNAEMNTWASTTEFGLVFYLNEFRFDAGMEVGINDVAGDFGFGTGLTYRF